MFFKDQSDSRWFDEPPVVSSKRRRTSHHRSQTSRPCSLLTLRHRNIFFL